MKKKKYKPRKKNYIKKEVVNSGSVGADAPKPAEQNTEPKSPLSGFRTEKPAQWLYVKFSDGNIYKIAAEKIAEMKVSREMGISMEKSISSQTTPDVFSKHVQEMLHFPYVLIDWMEEKLEWLDLVTIAMQTYASKPADFTQEWKTAKKGILYEGDEL